MAERTNMTMLDKNGIEIRTGDIVEITGAYFERDNGYYFVACAPGDAFWQGSDYSLTRISKRGKISKAKYNLIFWPIVTFVNDRVKRAEARQWNEQHAQIEVKTGVDLSEVIVYFQKRAEFLKVDCQRRVWDFGEDSDVVKAVRKMIARYEEIAAELRQKG